MPEYSPLVSTSRYDIFLSYAHTDLSIARDITTALMDKGVTVFAAFLQKDVMWGSDWKTLLNNLFPERSNAAMILLSQAYASAGQCVNELDLLMRKLIELPESGFVLPVRLDESPLPPQVAHLLYMDLEVTGITALAELTRKKLEDWKTETNELLASLSDEELMRRVASRRDTEAFRVLYERLYPWVRQRTLASGQSPETADDTVAEAMIRLWERADRFENSKSTLKAWISAVVRNVALDHQRRVSRVEDVESFGDFIFDPSSPERELILQEFAGKIRDAVELLPPKYQEVISAFLSGRSTSDTAGLLGVSESSVRLMQFRAIRELRTLVAPPRSR